MMHGYPNGAFYHPNIMPKMIPKQNGLYKRAGTKNQEQNANKSHSEGPPSMKYAHLPQQYFSQPQNLQQQMMNVERQLIHLISLIEENNRLLQGLQQMQQRVVTSGGGAVIVRM